MGRRVFRAALPALALTLYIGCTLDFSRRTDNTPAEAEPLKIVETVNVQSNGNRPFETAIIEGNSDKQKFHCADRETLEIWKRLKKTRYVIDQLQGETETGNCKDYIRTIKHIDLNNDGRNELYVISAPKIHPSAFAVIWIFQKTGGSYRQILEERDENYKILKTKTNGFHDLYFISRRTTHTMFLSTYKFKNGEYESVKCLVAFPLGAGEKTKLFDCDNEKGIEEFEREN